MKLAPEHSQKKKKNLILKKKRKKERKKEVALAETIRKIVHRKKYILAFEQEILLL